ncbi:MULTISPECIES: hypothetical protein [Stenotrophomonas]|uniref:hypothetical protein n=1 Tax=Stenotrophomonas TaxID=40323 RepID=UPI000C14C4DA|nr:MULTISPECIES: hypothetical protein [Stenotrophomonas]MDI9275002.1 hypothetical protein [Stenotrophomonas sp. PFBMAA-4]
MKTTEPRRAVRFRLEEGHEVAEVPLANGRGTASLYAEDYRRIIADGYHPDWCVTVGANATPYVATRGGRRTTIAARLVACAMPGNRVRYVDGDRFNLRWNNLLVTEGPSKQDARNIVEIFEAPSLKPNSAVTPVRVAEVAA